VSLRLLLGPAGARKTGRLLDAHQAAARNGSDAWLVVPGGADLVPIRRELLGLEAPGGMPRTPTPYADLFGASELERRLLAAAETAQPLRPQHRARILTKDQRRVIAQAVVRTAQREERLTALLPGARGGWLADDLVALSEELTITRDLGRTAEHGLEAWGGGAGGRRGRELAWLLREDAARRDALARHGHLDRATAALRVGEVLAGGALELDDLHVTFAAFDDLDPVQRALLAMLGRSAATVLLSLPYAEGREALAAAGPLVHALQDAGAQAETVAFDPDAVDVDPALSRLGMQLYESVPAGASSPASVAFDDGRPPVLELKGAGPDEELALVAELVAEELAAGTPASRLAVLVASPELHAPAIIAALARRGAHAHLGGRAPAANTPIVRGVVALLRAAKAHTAGGRDGGDAADVVAWLTIVDRSLAEIVDADIRRRGARTVRDALRIARYRAGGRIEELDRLERPGAISGQAGRPGSLEREIAAILDERAIAWVPGDGLRPDPGTERAIRAAREASRAMEARGAFVERAFNLPSQVRLPADLDDLRRALEELGLEAEPEPPGSVAVVGPLAVRTRTLDVLIIARAQRGAFPKPESARRALSPADRGALATDHGWPTPLDGPHASAERYLAYEIATTPTRRLALAWHAGDGDGGAAEASPLIAEVRRVVGPAVGLRELGAGTAATAGLEPARRAIVERAAAGPRHREVQHQRSEAIASAPRDHHGVGALQTASRCTAQWFVDQHLRPRPLDPDAAPLTAGRLRHDLLAELLREALDAGMTLAPESLPSLEAGLAASARRRAEQGKAADETLAERLLRERVVAEVEATLPTLCGTDVLAHQPSELELAFGTPVRDDPDDPDSDAPTGRPPVTIRRGDHELALSGRIDRLDLSPAGDEVVVVDYKGANVEPYRGGGWLERRELQAGLYALVAEQLTGASAVGSLYQPVPGPPEVPARGATVDRLADRGMKVKSNDILGQETWDELLDELVALAALAAQAIDDGEVAPCPSRCSDDGCRHPWLCREQRG
jgi:PD-(D/E)XK nuclease superfamily